MKAWRRLRYLGVLGFLLAGAALSEGWAVPLITAMVVTSAVVTYEVLRKHWEPCQVLRRQAIVEQALAMSLVLPPEVGIGGTANSAWAVAIAAGILLVPLTAWPRFWRWRGPDGLTMTAVITLLALTVSARELARPPLQAQSPVAAAIRAFSDQGTEFQQQLARSRPMETLHVWARHGLGGDTAWLMSHLPGPERMLLGDTRRPAGQTVPVVLLGLGMLAFVSEVRLVRSAMLGILGVFVLAPLLPIPSMGGASVLRSQGILEAIAFGFYCCTSGSLMFILLILLQRQTPMGVRHVTAWTGLLVGMSGLLMELYVWPVGGGYVALLAAELVGVWFITHPKPQNAGTPLAIN